MKSYARCSHGRGIGWKGWSRNTSIRPNAGGLKSLDNICRKRKMMRYSHGIKWLTKNLIINTPPKKRKEKEKKKNESELKESETPLGKVNDYRSRSTSTLPDLHNFR